LLDLHLILRSSTILGRPLDIQCYWDKILNPFISSVAKALKYLYFYATVDVRDYLVELFLNVHDLSPYYRILALQNPMLQPAEP